MERYLLLGVLGFASGILLQTLLTLSWIHVALVAFLAGLFILVFLVKRIALFLSVAALLIGVGVGMFRTELAPSSLPQEASELLETEQTLEGKVVADPDVRETSQRLVVETPEAKILVVAPLYPPVRYGEIVRITGLIRAPEPFDTSGGRTFAYDTFLAKEGIFLMMPQGDVEIVGRREGVLTHVRAALSDLKFSGIDALSRALPEPHASLASGLILGGKQGLGKELLDDFIRTGLVHIVVLSGYNVMIVAEFVMRAFGFLSVPLASSFGALTIGLFVLSAGAGPASIRAGLMAGIALYARATGKTYNAFRALLGAGVLMLLINPLTLPYDPGFQLSFLATLGLIFGVPVTERWVAFIKSGFIREVAAATIAAQIAVLPLLLYQNGLVSFVTLPVNLLVLPVVPLAMLASFVAMLSGWLLPLAAPALGLPAYFLLSYVIGVVGVAANLPLSAVTLPAFSFVFVVVTYALLSLYVRSQLQENAVR